MDNMDKVLLEALTGSPIKAETERKVPKLSKERKRAIVRKLMKAHAEAKMKSSEDGIEIDIRGDEMGKLSIAATIILGYAEEEGINKFEAGAKVLMVADVFEGIRKAGEINEK